jgi:hypothetical protein
MARRVGSAMAAKTRSSCSEVAVSTLPPSYS